LPNPTLNKKIDDTILPLELPKHHRPGKLLLNVPILAGQCRLKKTCNSDVMHSRRHPGKTTSRADAAWVWAEFANKKWKLYALLAILFLCTGIARLYQKAAGRADADPRFCDLITNQDSTSSKN
jgi:hypothetical protein